MQFTFCDEGVVNASDLAGLGRAAGYVTYAGEYLQEARHDRHRVYQAFRAAMEADPQRVWPERYRRFVEAMESHS